MWGAGEGRPEGKGAGKREGRGRMAGSGSLRDRKEQEERI